MEAKFKDLKQQYIKATTVEEKNKIKKQILSLNEENAETFGDIMLNDIKETNVKVSTLLVKEQLKDILSIISISYIATEYFNKSKDWLYQRINGNIVNGKPAKFNKKEIDVLNYALQDISKKIGSVSASL